VRHTVLATVIFGFGAIIAARPLNAGEPISVSVYPTIAVARGSAQLRVLVERNDANRALTWEVDGPGYYRSSTMQLDGTFAPKSWFFFVRDLPEGVYEVRATVMRNNRSQSMAMSKIVVVSGMHN
jgi:hypothetical protein